MRFEKFLLDNYMSTDEGRRISELFQNIHAIIDAGDKDERVINFINSLLYAPIAKEFFVFEAVSEPIEVGDLEYPPFSVFEDWARTEIEEIREDWNCTHRQILSDIPLLSIEHFARFAPEYAFPYLYPVHYTIIQDIFNEFDIAMPNIPGPRQYKERCYFYIEICRALYDFRKIHDMSYIDLCVFIYGFAQKFVKNNIKTELPRPSKVWIVGANAYDSTTRLADIQSDATYWWSGNSNMNVGDIVFIYELSPYSVIRSMWRTLSNGYDDPFQYYSGKVWLGNPIKIPDITFAELKENYNFIKHGLVRAHMQGLGSGVALSLTDYTALQNMLQSKGFDVSIMPELLAYETDMAIELHNEQDIEKYILEPFLAKLGVHQKHITRQMPLRMGRGIRYYPDYVINAKTTRGEEYGAFVWEAKYRIPSHKQMLEDFYQAKSYALRLNSNGLGLVSYEGIWLSFATDGYHIDKIEHFTWANLKNTDIYSSVSKKLKRSFGKL